MSDASRPAGAKSTAEYQRAYQKANRERLNAARRARYASDEGVRRQIRDKAKRNYNPEYYRAYKAANRERIREKHRDWTYGLKPGQYDAMLALQAGCCALCGVSAEGSSLGKLVVDHCHETSAVRGLLCLTCNTDLGVIERRREGLARLLEYADRGREADDKDRALRAYANEVSR